MDDEEDTCDFMILMLVCVAGALAEEGVRTAGAKLPYIIGGVAAIAIGVLITVAMVASKEGRAFSCRPKREKAIGMGLETHPEPIVLHRSNRLLTP